ncbi:hypothetical protein PSP6_560021 [Paraburkholderia tropica]|nr:hypothetical protein PSP6_560021 [Paraburkholderia tropica]
MQGVRAPPSRRTARNCILLDAAGTRNRRGPPRARPGRMANVRPAGVRPAALTLKYGFYV